MATGCAASSAPAGGCPAHHEFTPGDAADEEQMINKRHVRHAPPCLGLCTLGESLAFGATRLGPYCSHAARHVASVARRAEHAR